MVNDTLVTVRWLVQSIDWLFNWLELLVCVDRLIDWQICVKTGSIDWLVRLTCVMESIDCSFVGFLWIFKSEGKLSSWYVFPPSQGGRNKKTDRNGTPTTSPRDGCKVEEANVNAWTRSQRWKWQRPSKTNWRPIRTRSNNVIAAAVGRSAGRWVAIPGRERIIMVVLLHKIDSALRHLRIIIPMAPVTREIASLRYV